MTRLIQRVAIVALLLWSSSATAQDVPSLRIDERGVDEEEMARPFQELAASRVPHGLLVDQVPALVDPTAFNGSRQARAATVDDWRQLYHQLARSGAGPEARPHPRGGRRVADLPEVSAVSEIAGSYLERGLTPLAVLDAAFSRIGPDARDRGLLVLEGGVLKDRSTRGRSPFTTHRAFAAASFRQRSTSRRVRYVVPRNLVFRRGRAPLRRLTVDFDDGRGPQRVRVNEVVTVDYAQPGTKSIELTASSGGEMLTATTTMEVAAASVPTPDMAWMDQQATRAYAGGAAGYDAYFFFGDGNATLTRPVVFVEGFDPYYNDPAKRRTWEDIYDILLQEEFVVRLRALGYDAVIMKLDNAADYVQRNAFALEHLLDQLQGAMPAGEETIVVGPSMGGLIARYALSYMERNGLPHNVRLFASLDSPQQAANFPLGVQFFLEFNDGDSELAAQGKAAVNSVAARQMLAYQYRVFPEVDPLRAAFVDELAALGYPSIRKIAISNGSGTGQNQLGNDRVNNREMLPGDKIVEYRYRSWYVDLDGDVWALPDQSPETRIFEGLKDVIGPHYRAQDVYVSGTLPYDNTPGGSRGTQQEIADSDAPYGDILTAFPEHSWIPTVSALDLGTPDLAYNVAADPAGLVAEPTAGKQSSAVFDAIYVPEENQPHVFATPENVQFLLDEIDTYFPSTRTIAGDRTFNSGQRVAVADGARLTFTGNVDIASGVRFLLGRDAVLRFEGVVRARGTAAAPIAFERGGKSAWDHLDLVADGNVLEHVVLDGGTKTVEVRSRDNLFRYCTFRNGWRGISTYYTPSGSRSSFRLEHSTVSGNTSVGIVAYHSDPYLSHVTIRDNKQPGLWAYDASIPVFHRSHVVNNALGQTWRSGVEISGGSYVAFAGPNYTQGYTRIAGNTSHEINVSSSASGAMLGWYGYGGQNAIFDANEGGNAATELLVRSYLSSTVLADNIYWGGVYPDSDDISGNVYVGTVLYDDPTSEPAGMPLLASLAGGSAGGISGPRGDLAARMAKLRNALARRTVKGSASLLRELFMLQRMDPQDRLGEKARNRAVLASWRARLNRGNGRGVSAADRHGAEAAALLEVREALFEGRYEEAARLVSTVEPLVQGPHHRRALLLDRISLLEREGRFDEALAVLTTVEAIGGVERPEAFGTLREALEERREAGRGITGAASPSLATTPVARSEETEVGDGFDLGESFPNPFNPVTTVPFEVAAPAHVRIEVHDVLGRRVAVLVDGRYEAGAHTVRFDAGRLSSGVYLVRGHALQDDGRRIVHTRRVTLLQ